MSGRTSSKLMYRTLVLSALIISLSSSAFAQSIVGGCRPAVNQTRCADIAGRAEGGGWEACEEAPQSFLERLWFAVVRKSSRCQREVYFCNQTWHTHYTPPICPPPYQHNFGYHETCWRPSSFVDCRCPTYSDVTMELPPFHAEPSMVLPPIPQDAPAPELQPDEKEQQTNEAKSNEPLEEPNPFDESLGKGISRGKNQWRVGPASQPNDPPVFLPTPSYEPLIWTLPRRTDG